MAQQDLEDRLRRLVATYPFPQMALIPALGMLSEEGVETAPLDLLSEICGVTVDDIASVIRVHPELNGSAKPTPLLCTALSCYLRGAGLVADRMRAEPQLWGESFRESVDCLGYCFAGPVLLDSQGRLCRVELDSLTVTSGEAG